MIKKQSLIVLVFLCASFWGFGQITKQSFEASGDTWAPIVFSTPPCTNGDDIWDYSSSLSAITPNDGLQFWGIQDLEGNCGGSTYETITFPSYNVSSYTSVTISFDYYTIGYEASDNLGYEIWEDGIKVVDLVNLNDNTGGWLNVNYNVTASTTNVFLVLKADQNGGSDYGGFDNVILNGTPLCSDTLDYYNLQSPATGNITVGNPFNVYAQAYKAGVTEATGVGSGIETWIGYNTSNTDPSTWLESSWTSTPFDSQQGNNDEFRLEIGSGLAIGTYYYASRFRINGCVYTYGGFNSGGGDGVWDGTYDVNGILTINPDQVNFCNVDFPKTGNITTGSNFSAFAQVYEPGITEPAGQGANIQAWIGYNTIGINHQPWDLTGWTWIAATYDSDWISNDQYVVNIGCGLPAGTYYYASRFQLNGSSYSYGGIQADNVGNFWDTTNNNGTLTVTDPPLADVVITEIMYNTIGTDDEWIEICNVSGSTQDISNYSIYVDGSSEFTFPCNTTIGDGVCITIDLGDGGGADYNVDCPFGADYSNGLGTGTLANSTDTITIYASNGSTIADVVTYDNGDDSSTNGNGSSYHIIDISADNSNTNSNWEAVAYGGSPGINTLLPNCLPSGVEINVEGNLGSFPDIPDGHTTPSGTNNTLFAAQFVGASQSKSYRIQSLLATDVIISSITITGHATDFTVTSTPASPVSYTTPSILEITFSPTVAGTRTAVVHIFNNDTNEAEYTFTIKGEGNCIGVIDSITPTSGPENTIVTVSATGLDLSTASASFNGVPVIMLNYIVATDKLEVTVPDTATDGNLEIVDGLGCTGFFAFDVIDNTIGGCGGGSNLTDLFISEVTDATTGGLSYIEIYNGTGSTVNLGGYSLEIISNGNSSGNTLTLNNVSLANDDTYVVAIGVASSSTTSGSGANTCPINGATGGNGHLANQASTIGGINKKDNEHDMIRLVHSGSTVDEFGVYQDDDWMDWTIITGNRGLNFRRLATASPLPNPNFSLTGLSSNWNIIDWVGSGLSSCGTNDYSDIGQYDFSTGTPPMVTSGPTLNSSCNSATIEITALDGTDPAGLTYQWFYSAPGDPGWNTIPNITAYDYVSSTTAILSILNTAGLENYQYYCEVREDDALCATASDAVKLTLLSTTWTSSGWSDGSPDTDTIAIIDYAYNTGDNGDIEACNLIINSGITLDIDDSSYVLVQNNVLVYGNIIVRTSGSLVQVNDYGLFTLDSNGSAIVEKETSEFNQWYEYTYWSSPTENETIANGLSFADPNRRYWFNAQNYRDSVKENGNSNSFNPGQDDIDDPASEMDGTGTDWQTTSGGDLMIPGLGYASPNDPTVFSSTPGCPGCRIKYTFEGPFNTGDISISIYRNDDEMLDNNWNFLGNPYPSALDADAFLTGNSEINNDAQDFSPSGVDGAIFFWSQNSSHDSTNNGNQNLNFSQSDYAVINMASEAAGGDGITPSRYIPSGQGFFVSYTNGASGTTISSSPNPTIVQGTVTFTNNMRVTGDNSQFFRSTISKNGSTNKNVLKINLTSDNGVFNQLAIGYLDAATNDYDGMSYDAPRNLSGDTYSTIYTLIDGRDEKFVIQGKESSRLTLDEIIPIGFDTSIDVATLYTLSIAQLEGDFFNSNTIYLKDYEMNIVHNLSESDYIFTSDAGEFKERFEIMFTDASLPVKGYDLIGNSLSIIELDSDNVKFKTSSELNITTVKIFDVLGRLLYDLKGNNHSETYNLSSLSQTTYLAKIELSNGVIVTKKAVKRK